MSDITEELKDILLDTMEEASLKVSSATGDDLFDLIEPHPKFQHCEKYVVQLVNDLVNIINSKGFSVSKGLIIHVYLKYKSETNANIKRVEEIMGNLS